MYQNLNTRKRHLAAAIALAGISATSVAETVTSVPEEKDKEIEMIQVIGEATGGLDRLITLDQIETMQANNLGDLFKVDATISAGGPVGLSQKIYVRNTGEDALNISIDGAEVSAGVFHHSGRVLIEPELLKQVEIEAGTGTATAGNGALGGAVRFTTKDPADLLTGSNNFGALVKSTYYSNGEGWKNTVSLYGQDSGGIFSGLVSLTQSDQNNLEDADGNLLTGTEAKRDLGYAKVVANISEEQYLSLSYEKLEEKGDIHMRPEWIGGARNPLYPIEGTRETVIFNYGFDSTNNDLIDFSVNAYQTESEQYQDRSAFGYTVLGGVETNGATIKNESKIGNQTLTFGLNYRDDSSWLEEISEVEEGEVKAFFVQDVIELTEKLTVSAGLRFDDYDMNDWQDKDFSDNALSPNISANYKVSDSLHLSAGYAEAIRGVEIVDSYRLGYYFNSEDLEAEEAQSIELGLDYYGENFHIAFGAYKTTIDNVFGHFYVRNSMGRWETWTTNLDDELETEGFYLTADYQYGNLTVLASLHAADTEAGGQIATRYEYGSNATSIGDTFALTLDYAFNDNLNAGWTAEFVKGIHNIDITVDGEDISTDKPGYGTHDLYVKWTGLEQDRLSISLTVKNVFDKLYLSHASTEDFTGNPGYDMIRGHNEPGRDISLSASLRF